MKAKKLITTKKLWDESAEKYAVYQQGWQSAVDNLKKALRGIKIKKNWDILDLACGPGNSTRFLAKQALEGEVFGVDISKKMIAIAKRDSQNFRNINYFISSVEKFSTKKRFNLTVINYGFWFFKNPEKIVRKIFTLLKPKGILVMTLLFPSVSAKEKEICRIKRRVAEKHHLKTVSHSQLVLLPVEELIKNKFILKVWKIDSRPSHPWQSLNEFMEIPVMNSNIFKGGTLKKRSKAIADLVKKMQAKKVNPGYVRWQTIVLKKI